MKRSLWLLFPFAWLLLLGCDQGNIEMDNAGEEDLRVVIDELAYSMPAGSFQRIDLESGLHTLTIKGEDGKILDEQTFSVVEGGLLNLAKSTYYIWVDLYGEASLRDEVLSETWIEIGNESFFGEFERVPAEKLYVERKWDFGLEEPFPDDLYGWKITQDKWIIRRKLFREQELIQAYKDMVQQ
jgi:hypothetical protein